MPLPFLPHRASLWRRIGTDANSRPVVASEVEGIDCRWDDTQRIVHGTDGQPRTVDATAVVPVDVPIGSAMWRGDPDDLPGTGRTPERDVFEVITTLEEADYYGQNIDLYREVTLVRAGDRLPTTATGPDL